MHKISVSDLCLLGENNIENVRVLAARGVRHIELMMDGVYWNCTEMQLMEIAVQMMDIAKETGVCFTVHPPAWDTNLAVDNDIVAQATFDEYRKGIVLAGKLHAQFAVMHPGFWGSPAFDRKNAQEHAYRRIVQLNEIAKPLGVKLAVENVGYKGTSLFDMEEWIAFVDRFDDNVFALLDTGHALLNHWDIAEVVRRCDRLRALHIHGNDGTGDQHLPIGSGSVDWDAFFACVKARPEEMTLVLEYHPGAALDTVCADAKRLEELMK